MSSSAPAAGISEQDRRKRSGYQLTDGEHSALVAACGAVPPATQDYRISDYVENLLLTVMDFQLRTTTVERAMKFFIANTKPVAPDLRGLKQVLAQYPDDDTGNVLLAQRLWNYRYAKRAGILRRLVEFFDAEGVDDQPSLARWAFGARYETHFAGRIKGLGPAVFNWLCMRQGVETIKADIHVMRFVCHVLGRTVSEQIAVQSLIRVAHALGKPAYELDWAIWEAGIGRSGLTDSELVSIPG